ncbi:hypothetical protein EI94DRAFT_557752 [Lactarius quietus]|nr:hypothetical protein EI94DRAFT_557752 [Lactarius quietus]
MDPSLHSRADKLPSLPTHSTTCPFYTVTVQASNFKPCGGGDADVYFRQVVLRKTNQPHRRPCPPQAESTLAIRMIGTKDQTPRKGRAQSSDHGRSQSNCKRDWRDTATPVYRFRENCSISLDSIMGCSCFPPVSRYHVLSDTFFDSRVCALHQTNRLFLDLSLKSLEVESKHNWNCGTQSLSEPLNGF